MIITTQDYINVITLLLMYFTASWILIGISALAVKHFWHDSMDRQDVNVTVRHNKSKQAV